YASPKAPHDAQPPVVPVYKQRDTGIEVGSNQGLRGEWHPDVDQRAGLQPEEFARQNANDRERDSGNGHFSAGNAGIAAKSTSRIAMTDDAYRRRPRSVITVIKQSTGRGLDAECREDVGRGHLPARQTRRAVCHYVGLIAEIVEGKDVDQSVVFGA